jgi:hypothetical protein
MTTTNNFDKPWRLVDDNSNITTNDIDITEVLVQLRGASTEELKSQFIHNTIMPQGATLAWMTHDGNLCYI